MKQIITIFAFLLSFASVEAQVKQVELHQTPGAFTSESLSLESGQYQFNIVNDNVGHEVGFVLVPKGKYDASDHIKEAYVTAPVATGKTVKSNVVTLAAGEYEYFCPLNPTPKYSLTVNEKVEKVKLTQMPGKFTDNTITLTEGTFQFEIANDGVDHEVGFVLVPKGKYDASDHIKEAYVTAPVATGKSSMTKIVNLEAGEYEYFCPLNPTPKYSLTVNEKVEKVKLTQMPGKFTDNTITLTEGTFQFEIANDGVDHEVGFVLVPKGKYDASDHIKEAYVTAPVATGKSSMTKIVNLEAGEYEYFCPLNPTPKYSLTVNDRVEKVKLTQTPGKFADDHITLTEGTYQFEIANDGVDHEVGFVLVPKGKYDAGDHIKEAYVTAPVASGKSSMTKIVKLAAGEYEYFCPLNPTPKYSLTVN